MRTRVLPTLIGVLLVTAAVGVFVVRHRPEPGSSTRVATASPIHASPVGKAVVRSDQEPATEPTTPPTTPPPTSVTGSSTTAPRPVTSTTVAPPPTTKAGPATTATSVAPTGPPTGRLAVSLAVRTVNGSGVGGGIATMAADGSNRHVLITGNYFAPRWTPDGRLILYASSDSSAMWAIPAGGGTPTQLASDVTGPLSPDGRRVLHWLTGSDNTAPAPLTVQPVLETATALVADGPPIALGVSGFGALWSPDGRRVLYATQFGVNSDLAVVNADGTGRRDLLAGASVKASMISPPGFSADGATVSFVGSDNTAYFVGADGHNLRPALPPVVAGASTVTAFATAWSPDHSSLAVLTGGAGLVVVVDTSSHVQASVTLPASAAPLTISFDGSGRYIYYMGFPRGGVPSPPMNLFSVALNGGAAAQLTTDGSVAITPTVLP